MKYAPKEQNLGITPYRNYQYSLDRSKKAGRLLILFLLWLLSFISFSPPGREIPLSIASLDWVAVLKLSSRIIAFCVLCALFVKYRSTDEKRYIFIQLRPFIILALWLVISITWSPFKDITLGHSIEVLMSISFSYLVALLFLKNRDQSTLCYNFFVISILICLGCLVAWHLLPSSKLQFGRGIFRPYFFMHPNAIALLASIGLINLVVLRTLWRWRWTRIFLMPGVIIYCYTIIIAQSRTAIFATLAIFVITVCLVIKRSLVFLGSIIIVFIVSIILLLGLHENIVDKTTNYLTRGQTKEEVISATGRMDIWNYAIKSFLQSPIIGHGYFIMSPIGLVDVWGTNTWKLTHSIFLHILTGVGIIGMILFLWAMLKILRIIQSGLKRGGEKKRVAIWCSLIFGWFLLVGIYEISFFGQINAVTMFFYITLGIAFGRLKNNKTSDMYFDKNATLGIANNTNKM